MMIVFMMIALSAYSLYIKHFPTETMIKQRNDLDRAQDLDHIYLAVRGLMAHGEVVPDSLSKVNVTKASDAVPVLKTVPVSGSEARGGSGSGVNEPVKPGYEVVKDIKHDPVTGELYRYSVISDTELELCAEFETDTRGLLTNGRFIENHMEERQAYLRSSFAVLEPMNFNSETSIRDRVAQVANYVYEGNGENVLMTDPYFHQAGLHCVRYSLR